MGAETDAGTAFGAGFTHTGGVVLGGEGGGGDASLAGFTGFFWRGGGPRFLLLRERRG